jgi:predicted metalloprotease
LSPHFIAFDVHTLELFLKVLILRQGGSVTINADSKEMAAIDDVVLFANSEDEGRGLTLSTARVGEDVAGHA